MTSPSLLAALALLSVASPAFADEAIVSANGKTVIVSTSPGTAGGAPPATTVAVTAPATTVAVATEPAHGQDLPPEPVLIAPPPRPRNTLAIDALAVVPVGDYGRAIDLGVGAGVRLEVPAGRGFITGRIGAVFHRVDGNGQLTIAPVYAGYRQPIGTGSAYLAGELGITLAWASVDTAYGRASASDSDIGAMLSAGARLGALDLRAGLFSPDLDDAFGLIATAGYDFAAF